MRIIPFLHKFVIAPHGITDIIHAQRSNHLSELLQIYIGTIGISEIIQLIHQHNILHILFGIASATHFQHDMKDIYIGNFKIKKSIISYLFILSTPIIGMNIFTFYMVIFHVPRHYLKSYFFLKDHLIDFHTLLILVMASSSFIYNEIEYSHNEQIITLIEALIIAHVIYNEKYVDNITCKSNNTRVGKL